MTSEEGLLARFTRYRFDYSSLVFDSIRAFLSEQYRTAARLTTVPLFLFMLLPPTVTLVIGISPFGNPYAFAATLIAWPWILEKPAWSLRQLRAESRDDSEGGEGSGFDWFIHAVFCALAVSSILAVSFAEPELTALGDWALGLVWAIALAGSTDVARSVVAFFLARLNGFPLYGQGSRRP